MSGLKVEETWEKQNGLLGQSMIVCVLSRVDNARAG
jgi:hypothetical protein